MEDHLVIASKAAALIARLADAPVRQRVAALNAIKLAMRAVSPMAEHPADCVLWIPSDEVSANDYNPNSVAPPEMRLLELSIVADGFTQPIVAAPEEGIYRVVDGFHRATVGKSSKAVAQATHGFLPIATIRGARSGKPDRMASTIRHNRARGKHAVGGMSAIVIDLTRRNWSEQRIAKELGMEPDEVLRLKQITGLAEMFANRDFSEAWEIDEAAL